MRNEALSQLEDLVGERRLTMTDDWFLESPVTEVEGVAPLRRGAVSTRQTGLGAGRRGLPSMRAELVAQEARHARQGPERP